MFLAAISEGHGDAAMVLLKAGAESDKRDENDKLAMELAPDKKVNTPHTLHLLFLLLREIPEIDTDRFVDTVIHPTVV